MNELPRKRILVCPLDWGLGHATRCIPIINHLLEKKQEVIIAADKGPLELLRREFPSLEFIVLPGYNIVYPDSGRMTFKMISEGPKIIKAIKREHLELDEIIRRKKIDAVISDNRYGLWSKQVPCIFITHQLTIRTALFEGLLNYINHYYIKKFRVCWVPDIEGTFNLSGDLSHKYSLPPNARYIGWLSRFSVTTIACDPSEKFDLVVTLSGPEPQRGMFENIILEQLGSLPSKTLIVRGIPSSTERKKISSNIEMVSHLETGEMQRVLQNAEVVLSRSGYSTIMDLAVLGKKAVFVPTPGQTEQKYLAKRLRRKGFIYSTSQEKFDLRKSINASALYKGFNHAERGIDFRPAVDTFLRSIL